MEKLISNIVLFLALSTLDSFGQKIQTDSKLYTSVFHEISQQCDYDKSDSIIVVLQNGFNGNFQLYINDSMAFDLMTNYSSSNEMAADLIKLKFNEGNVITMRYQNEQVKLLLDRNFGVLFLKRKELQKMGMIEWNFFYSNCFYLARR